MDADMRRALDERAHLMEERAMVLVENALKSRGSWIAALGRVPVDAVRVGSCATTRASSPLTVTGTAFSMMTRSALPLHRQTSELTLRPQAWRVIAQSGCRRMPLLHSRNGSKPACVPSTTCSPESYPSPRGGRTLSATRQLHA